jgi:hypothetical protein
MLFIHVGKIFDDVCRETDGIIQWESNWNEVNKKFNYLL